MFTQTDKTFKGDFDSLFKMLQSGEKFAFSKYADGEFEILRNRKITNCDNWTFNPEKHKAQYDELLSSFKFKEEGYYVGISCPCCVKQRDVNWMRENVGVNKDCLTWANIFVNSNYDHFKNTFLKEFANHDVILVANRRADVSKLPFKVEEHIKITGVGFVDNFDLVESLPKKEYKDKLFLFCAGPLGNMLAAKMWEHNKNNIYLDIGSTLNPMLMGRKNRGYLNGRNTKKVCRW